MAHWIEERAKCNAEEILNEIRTEVQASVEAAEHIKGREFEYRDERGMVGVVSRGRFLGPSKDCSFFTAGNGVVGNIEGNPVRKMTPFWSDEEDRCLLRNGNSTMDVKAFVKDILARFYFPDEKVEK